MPVVLVAPIAAEVLASTLAQPQLLTEVAFGTRQGDLDAPPGMPVFLYVVPDYSGYRDLVRPGLMSWTGTLGALVPAVGQGLRRGMHPDPAVRPPFAERYDYRDAAMFWHVHGLAPLAKPLPFKCFRDADGTKVFGGFAPQWLARAFLVGQDEADQPAPALRVA